MSTSVATSSNAFVCELRHFCGTQDNQTSRCTILQPHLEESNERPSFFDGHAGGVYERLDQIVLGSVQRCVSRSTPSTSPPCNESYRIRTDLMVREWRASSDRASADRLARSLKLTGPVRRLQEALT